LYTKQCENENVAEIFCKSLWNYIEKVWSSEVKPMMMTEDIKSTLTMQHNVGFAKTILPRKIKKFAITVILMGNTEVLLIKNVTHFSGNQNLCL